MHFATCETSLSLDHALLVEFQILHLQPLHMEPEQGPGYDDFNEGHGPAVRCHVNFYYHLLRIPHPDWVFILFSLLGLLQFQWIIQVFPRNLAINWSHLLCRDVRRQPIQLQSSWPSIVLGTSLSNELLSCDMDMEIADALNNPNSMLGTITPAVKPC